MKVALNLELSPKELMSIGKIVALWGFLEYEIFSQTVMCYEDVENSAIPKALVNNTKFDHVLSLWAEHVLERSTDACKEVFKKQLSRIHELQDYRNSLVHGMWDWSKSEPEKLTTVRARNRQLITTHFTAEDLASFVSELETIIFSIKYPGGAEDLVKKRVGSYISRSALCMMIDHPLAADLLPFLKPPQQ